MTKRRSWFVVAVFLLLKFSSSQSQRHSKCASDSDRDVSLTTNPGNDFITNFVELICCSGVLDSAAHFYFQASAGSIDQFRLIKRNDTFENRNTLTIYPFGKEQDGKYYCSVGQRNSSTLSLRKLDKFLLVQPLKNYSLYEGASFNVSISPIAETESYVTLVKEDTTGILERWDLGALATPTFTYPFSFVSLNRSGLYSFKARRIIVLETEKSWTFTVHVKRVPWMHPTCVALNSSSVRVQWDHFSTPRPDESHDDQFLIIVRTDFGYELANVSASTGQSHVVISDLRGCGRYVIETVGSQDKRSSSSVSCDKTPQELERGKFAEDVEKRIFYVGDDGRIMRVCLPSHYIDNAENRSVLCQKFKELKVISVSPTQPNEPFVKLRTLEIDLENFTLKACMWSCPPNRILNLTKCERTTTSSGEATGTSTSIFSSSSATSPSGTSSPVTQTSWSGTSTSIFSSSSATSSSGTSSPVTQTSWSGTSTSISYSGYTTSPSTKGDPTSNKLIAIGLSILIVLGVAGVVVAVIGVSRRSHARYQSANNLTVIERLLLELADQLSGLEDLLRGNTPRNSKELIEELRSHCHSQSPRILELWPQLQNALEGITEVAEKKQQISATIQKFECELEKSEHNEQRMTEV